MQQPYEDLTLSEALRDPMILAVAHADGVTTVELGRMLHTAAKRLRGRAPRTRSAQASARRFAGEAETAPLSTAILRKQPPVSQCCGFF